METIRSADGTRIAYEATGSGPALILVGGAFSNRSSGLAVGAAFASHFTVYGYDRRGRGDSGDTEPYAIEREMEDLAALADAVGGAPFVYGHSSGGALALEAASAGVPMRALAVYEPPYTLTGVVGAEGAASAAAGRPPTAEFAAELRALLESGRRDQAAHDFLASTGAPEPVIEQMKQSDYWAGMVAIAHTLPYDVLLCHGGVVPLDRIENIVVPLLALAGGASPSWGTNGARLIAGSVSAGEYRILEGQTHAADPGLLVPVLTEFFLRH